MDMRSLMRIVESVQRFVAGKPVTKFYHGTPMYRWEKIKTDGLVPSSASRPGMEPGVYISHQIGIAEHYASMNFGENDKQKWAILEIDASGLDETKLVADNGQEAELNWDDIQAHGYTDEQIRAGDFPWWISLQETGQAIYLGRIPAAAIRLVKVV